MSELFFTELHSARELNNNNVEEVNITKGNDYKPLPLIPPRINIMQSRFQFVTGQNIKQKKKTITIKRRPATRAQPVRLDKVTEFVIAYPTKIPNNLQEVEIVEKQLSDLYKYYSNGGDCDNASEIQRTLNSVKQKKQFLLKNDYNSPCQKEEMKKQELQYLIDNYLDEWDKILQKFMTITEQQAQRIANNQQEELETFDDEIPQELTAEFRKFSPSLLDKRAMEKSSAQIQDYQRAIILQREVKRLEREESKIQMERMREHYMNKRMKLTQKHREQMAVFFEHAESTRIKIICMRNQMINGYINRMNKLDDNINTKCRDVYAIRREDIPTTALSKERKAVVRKADKTPIPKCRPGTSFMTVRAKLQ